MVNFFVASRHVDSKNIAEKSLYRTIINIKFSLSLERLVTLNKFYYLYIYFFYSGYAYKEFNTAVTQLLREKGDKRRDYAYYISLGAFEVNLKFREKRAISLWKGCK